MTNRLKMKQSVGVSFGKRWGKGVVWQLRGHEQREEERGEQQQAGARAATLASRFSATSFFPAIALATLTAAEGFSHSHFQLSIDSL